MAGSLMIKEEQLPDVVKEEYEITKIDRTSNSQSEFQLTGVGKTGQLSVGSIQVKQEPLDWPELANPSKFVIKGETECSVKETDPLSFDQDDVNPPGLGSSGTAHVSSLLLKEPPPVAQDKLYTCFECGYICRTLNFLKHHMRIHAKEKPFACEMCDFRSWKSDQMKLHMMTHKVDIPLTSDICNCKSRDKSTLSKHIRAHSGKKPYACVDCDYRCRSKTDLSKHTRSVHTGEKPHACNVCEYRSSELGRLKVHMMIHTGEKPHACTICDFRCRVKSNLMRHTSSKHPQAKTFYACDLCEYSFDKKTELKSHMKTHDEESYSCGCCSFRCNKKYKLNRHIEIHTREISCDSCEFKADNFRQLRKHKKVHQASTNPHSCEICDYTCHSLKFLEFHMRSHTGVDHFGCKVCKFTFKTFTILTRHMKKFHQMPREKLMLRKVKTPMNVPVSAIPNIWYWKNSTH